MKELIKVTSEFIMVRGTKVWEPAAYVQMTFVESLPADEPDHPPDRFEFVMGSENLRSLAAQFMMAADDVERYAAEVKWPAIDAGSSAGENQLDADVEESG